MNEALKMQISAFVDGELPDNEAELLLRRLSQDAKLREQVASYLDIGRLIRRDRDVPGMEGLRGSISAALGTETIVAPPEEPAVGARLMNPTTGIAVAATVAVVALLGLSQLSGTEPTGIEDAVAIDLAPAYTEPPVSMVLANQPSNRLRDMHRRHVDSSTVLGSGDILYRMATFELREGELVEIDPDPHLLPEDEDASEAAPAGSE
jgi:negative regulator of sigma E activity